MVAVVPVVKVPEVAVVPVAEVPEVAVAVTGAIFE